MRQPMGYKSRMYWHTLYHFLNKTPHLKNETNWKFLCENTSEAKIYKIVSDLTCDNYESPCQLTLCFRKEHNRHRAFPYRFSVL